MFWLRKWLAYKYVNHFLKYSRKYRFTREFRFFLGRRHAARLKVLICTERIRSRNIQRRLMAWRHSYNKRSIIISSLLKVNSINISINKAIQFLLQTHLNIEQRKIHYSNIDRELIKFLYHNSHVHFPLLHVLIRIENKTFFIIAK